MEDKGWKYIKIFSDSQAALLAIDSENIQSLMVYDTHHSMNILGKKVRRLSLTWIKAHCGHEGNEEADSLARHGTTLPQIKTIPVPKSHIKNIISENIYNVWQIRWNEEKTCRQTRFFFDKISSNRSKEILKMSRGNITRICEIITGHNNLKYCQFLQGNFGDYYCRFCEEEIETFIHFVTNCPRLRLMREEILKHEINGTEAWNVGRVLEFSHIPAIDSFLIQDYS